MAKRGRPKKVKEIKVIEPVKEIEKQDEPPEIVKEPEVKDNSGLADQPYLSIDEAARFLGVNNKCARLWFDHGHLSGTDDRGYIRVSRASILRVKVSKLIVGPVL